MLIALIIFVFFLAGWLAYQQVWNGDLAMRIDQNFLAQQLQIEHLVADVKVVTEEVKELKEGKKQKVYTEDEKKECVDAVASGLAIRAVSRKTGIPFTTIHGWVKKARQ